MCQEKKEEGDPLAFKIVLTHRYKDSQRLCEKVQRKTNYSDQKQR